MKRWIYFVHQLNVWLGSGFLQDQAFLMLSGFGVGAEHFLNLKMPEDVNCNLKSGGVSNGNACGCYLSAALVLSKFSRLRKQVVALSNESKVAAKCATVTVDDNERKPVNIFRWWINEGMGLNGLADPNSSTGAGYRIDYEARMTLRFTSRWPFSGLQKSYER